MRAAKVDENQAEIVDCFRKLGFSVQCLHTVGKGVPDLLIAKAGINYLVEVKMPKGTLTKDQVKWHGEWRGDIHIVRCIDDVLTLSNSVFSA